MDQLELELDLLALEQLELELELDLDLLALEQLELELSWTLIPVDTYIIRIKYYSCFLRYYISLLIIKGFINYLNQNNLYLLLDHNVVLFFIKAFPYTYSIIKNFVVLELSNIFKGVNSDKFKYFKQVLLSPSNNFINNITDTLIIIKIKNISTEKIITVWNCVNLASEPSI